MMTMLLAAMTMGAAAQSLGSPMNGVSQNDTTEAKPNGWPETMVAPQFPGGDEALKKYLKKNVQYPELADQYSVEGKVIMHFTVEKDGTVRSAGFKTADPGAADPPRAGRRPPPAGQRNPRAHTGRRSCS